MRKLLFIFIALLSFGFMSCNTDDSEESFEIPRSVWDKDNIAYKNTTADEINGYTRVGTGKGIVGTFGENLDLDGISQGQHITKYIFYPNGTFYYHYQAYLNKHTDTKYTGTYKVFKDNDKFILKLTSVNHGWEYYYYSVNDTKLHLDYIYDYQID